MLAHSAQDLGDPLKQPAWAKLQQSLPPAAAAWAAAHEQMVQTTSAFVVSHVMMHRACPSAAHDLHGPDAWNRRACQLCYLLSSMLLFVMRGSLWCCRLLRCTATHKSRRLQSSMTTPPARQRRRPTGARGRQWTNGRASSGGGKHKSRRSRIIAELWQQMVVSEKIWTGRRVDHVQFTYKCTRKQMQQGRKCLCG